MVQKQVLDTAADYSADEETADDVALRDERRQQVLQALEQLPNDLRLVLEWKYIDKLSVTEIAERLQRTEKSIESLLYRGRKAFRALLSDEDERALLSEEKMS